jgi:nitrogen PTS system EIIA component
MPDLFTAQQLADYLQLSKRTIYRLVERNQIPAVRVGGQWRFPKSAVDYWLDMRLSVLPSSDLNVLQADVAESSHSLAEALADTNALIAVPAGDKSAVVRAFVGRVEFPGPVDRDLVTRRVLEREELCSTAMPGGVAVLHTARWEPRVLRSHDVVAVARLSEPVDFGALDGGRTESLVLVLARNERSHLVLLTRMTRLCHEAAFVRQLGAARSAAKVRALVVDFERTVFRAAQPTGA